MERRSLYAFLCTAPPPKVAARLRQLLHQFSEETVSTDLLNALEQGAVPASIFSILLSVCKSPGSLNDALHQRHSVLARNAAIRELGKRLRSRDWQQTWDSLGGTEGLLALFANYSVDEVKLLVGTIRRSNKGQECIEKQERVTELLLSLLSFLYPNSRYQNKDKRPLYQRYASLAPACSEDLVRGLLNQSKNPLRHYFPQRFLLKCNYTLLREFATQATFSKDRPFSEVESVLIALCRRAPSGPTDQPRWSASMSYSLSILRKLAAQTEMELPESTFHQQLVEPLLKRALRKRLDSTSTTEIMDLTITYLKSRPDTVSSLRTDSGSFFWCVFRCWASKPSKFEQQFIGIIRLLPQSAIQRVELYVQLSRSLYQPRRYRFLRLLLLHDESLGVDIDTEESLKLLPVNNLGVELFTELPRNQALPLLQRIMRVKTDIELFTRNSGLTILAPNPGQSTSEQDGALLLAFLERGEEGASERAQKAVGELKRKSTSSREHTDRAMFAKAALMWSIASDSLKLYGETVIWAHRFMRDPLTLKTVYGRSATNTSEGVTLLTGIPPDSSRAWTVSDIRSRVSEANGILWSFFKTYSQAKNELHFYENDWKGVLSLPEQVVDARLARAADLQRTLNLSNDQLYDMLWDETLAMLMEMSEYKARDVFFRLKQSIPPRSLAKLAETTLEKFLSKPDDARSVSPSEHIIFDVICFLAEGDRPDLASNLILKAIFGRPESSTWHRKLLTKSLVKRLPAKDAQNLLDSFAILVRQKLEAQAQLEHARKASSDQGTAANPSKTVIKVTTVKYLAQLLDDAEFVPPSFAVNVLSRLLRDAKHLDIRVAVVESMLGMLARCLDNYSNNLAAQILTALEETIPIVGSVNERRAMQESDWLEAEKECMVPVIYEDGGMDSIPPLADLLVNWRLDLSKWRRHIVQRIILPVVETSRVNNERWMKIFLAKHKLASPSIRLPSIPVKPMLLARLLFDNIWLTPASVLEQYQMFVLTNVNPSSEIRAVTEKVKKNAELRSSNEGQHWLALYDQGPGTHAYGYDNLRNMISAKWQPSEISDGVNVPLVQRAILAQAEALVCIADDTYEHWDSFIDGLQPPLSNDTGIEHKQAWVSNAKPVLQEIIVRIEGLRTLEWQTNPYRQPAVLPPTIQQRLWLLPYPSLPSAEKDALKRCKTFVEEVVAIIDRALPKGMQHSPSREQLLTAMSRCHEDERVKIACYLGDLGVRNAPDASGHETRVFIAEGLLNAVGALNEKDVKAVMEMLETWRRSIFEEIRMRRFSVVRHLSEHGAWKKAESKDAKLLEKKSMEPDTE